MRRPYQEWFESLPDDAEVNDWDVYDIIIEAGDEALYGPDCDSREFTAAASRIFELMEQQIPHEDHCWRDGSDLKSMMISVGVTYHEARLEGKQPSNLDIAKELHHQIGLFISDIRDRSWIACLPLERCFETFPEFVDFGEFHVLNPCAGAPGAHRDVCADFQRLLAEHSEVNFMPALEVNGSYLDAAKDIFHRTHGYIPGRPQLVVKLGPAFWRSVPQTFREKMLLYIPLLRLCQVAYHFECTNQEWFATQEGRLPGGRGEMPSRTMEMPTDFLLVDQHNGSVLSPQLLVDKDQHHLGDRPGMPDTTFDGSHQDDNARLVIAMDGGDYVERHRLSRPQEVIGRRFETAYGSGYDVTKFREIWARYAEPFLRLKKLTGNFEISKVSRESGGKQWEQLYRAACVTGNSLHDLSGTLTLMAVSATEMLLNPKDNREDLKRRFSDRLPLFFDMERDEAERLYNYRCVYVHNSDAYSDMYKFRSRAVRAFLAVFHAVTTWAEERMRSAELCGPAAFNEYCEYLAKPTS